LVVARVQERHRKEAVVVAVARGHLASAYGQVLVPPEAVHAANRCARNAVARRYEQAGRGRYVHVEG